MASESAKNGEILVDPGHENISNKVVAEVLGQGHVSHDCRMVNNVHDESQEAIAQVFPRIWFLGKASLQKFAIEIGKSHGKSGGTSCRIVKQGRRSA